MEGSFPDGASRWTMIQEDVVLAARGEECREEGHEKKRALAGGGWFLDK